MTYLVDSNGTPHDLRTSGATWCLNTYEGWLSETLTGELCPRCQSELDRAERAHVEAERARALLHASPRKTLLPTPTK